MNAFRPSFRTFLRTIPVVAILAMAPAAWAVKTVEDATVISSAAIASMHMSNGNYPNNDPGGGYGGGPNLGTLFNGRFGGDYVFLPNMNEWGGGYVLLDFTSMLATGYYITEIKVGAGGKLPYSLYWSSDGSSWTIIADHDGGTPETEGSTLVYAVGDVATHVKLVFHSTPRWDYSTPQISEIQVWGLDPAEMSCTHPSFTAWEMQSPATCTTRQVDVRHCTKCNEEFTQMSGAPLGHEYVTHLEKEGKCRRFGRGSISCSRCDWLAEFPEPRDLYAFGGETELYKVQFMDMTASSESHPAWGTGLVKAHDNNWTSGYWSNVGLENAWIDFAFGTAIDLTSVEFSVLNHAQTIQFCSMDGETETLLKEVEIVPDESEGAPSTQRMTVDFTETHVTRLRVRVVDSIGIEVWSSMSATMCEIHPYGTVLGAGHPTYDPTTLMVLR